MLQYKKFVKVIDKKYKLTIVIIICQYSCELHDQSDYEVM
jgi:hypothetical protein